MVILILHRGVKVDPTVLEVAMVLIEADVFPCMRNSQVSPELGVGIGEMVRNHHNSQRVLPDSVIAGCMIV
jgi:hypothetical protein